MVILGIDPGTATIGYGVIKKEGSRPICVQYGCILTKPAMPTAKRFLLLARDFAGLIKTHKPDIIAMERLFFLKNVKTATRVSQAQGVVILGAAQHDIRLMEYTPPEIKMAVCGYGRADKQQVAKTVQKYLSLPSPPKPDDAADALATALCCFWQNKYGAITKPSNGA